jgi:hypothetical protein
MLNPARDLEYPFALGIMDMSTIDVVPKKDIPAEHALDKDDVINPPDGMKPVVDKPGDTCDKPDGHSGEFV